MNKKKIIIIAVVSVLALGGIIGGVVGYNVYQEKKAEEALVEYLKELDAQRQTAVAGYNDRIAQAVNFDVNATSDVDTLNNAINSLNAVSTDVANDIVLSDEQKAEINAKVTEQVNVLNARISAVNEAKAAAEKKAAEAKKAEATKSSSNKSSAKASNSSSNSGSGNSAPASSGSSAASAPAPQSENYEEKAARMGWHVSHNKEEADAYADDLARKAMKEYYGVDI